MEEESGVGVVVGGPGREENDPLERVREETDEKMRRGRNLGASRFWFRFWRESSAVFKDFF